MALIAAKWTVKDYHRMIAAGILEGRQVELLNGEIIEMPPEGPPHAYFSDETADYLERLLGDRAKVREGKPITLPNDSEPEPDISIVQPLGEVYAERHPHAEDVFWLIEFSNTSLTKDLEDKTKIYASAQIQEYWVADLRNKQLIVFRSPANGDYTSENTLTQGDVAPLAFPDAFISVRRLVG
ncbi:Uma2 family endonuclease [Oculatella sp. LEGE 06141]|nr:Uma2 family endonuclease [Oculatella sp. LEGE 06141]MBE9178718.1 Uma2 family endonuclease [Oculatella sp. LEGE 06141]